MTRACHGPIRAAVGDAFSDEELDGILDRLARRKASKSDMGDGEGWATAAREIVRDELEKSAIDKRARAFAQAARATREKHYAGRFEAGFDEADALRAESVGSDKQGRYTASSVDAEGRALTTSLWGRVETGLKAIDGGVMDRLVNFFGVGDQAFERNVAREMSRLRGGAVEATGDASAVKVAEVLSAALEEGRQLQNQAGAWIGDLPGYIARQQHDQLKVAGGFWREVRVLLADKSLDAGAARLKASRRAFREWRDFIRPKLDPKTFAGIDPAEHLLDDAAALQAAGVIDTQDLEERFLFRVWSDIVSGTHETLSGASDVGEFRPPAGKAASVSKARVLHFAGPDAWMDYHGKFGSGPLLGAIMGDLERASQNTALMRRFGPNPQAAFENDVARLGERARARGDTQAMRRLKSPQRMAEFGEITGANNQPGSVRFAMIGRAIRLDQTLSKLGGMMLSSIGSDQALAATAMKRAGGKWLDGYAGAFGGISRLQSADAKAAADLLDAGARSFAAHLQGRFTAGDGPMGWGSYASRLFYKINGFQFLSDGQRAGMASMLSAHLGEQAQHAWPALNAGTRESLERYGLDAASWEALRSTVGEAASDGRRYFTLEGVAAISDGDAWKALGVKGKKATPEAAARFRGDLELRARTLTTAFLDDTLTEPRARERVSLTRGMKPGTILGEAVRTATQFWSFNQAVVGRHLAPAARGYAGQKPVALLAHLILATTLGGYMAMQAKQIVKGREFRPLTDDDGGVNGGVWLAALLQGGGLGIYGDFLFGEANRNGLGFSVGSMAGPAISEMEAVASIVRSAVSGDFEDLPADLVRGAVRNTPFANLWYTRLALDYTVLWRLQEALSPGYLSRYEDRVEDEEGAAFWLRPTDALP